MGTKNHPGKFDCYAAAEPDEPMFILLARDPLAAHLVAAWVALRAGDLDRACRMMRDGLASLVDSGKEKLPYNSPKSVEAQQCAMTMRIWRLSGETDNPSSSSGQ